MVICCWRFLRLFIVDAVFEGSLVFSECLKPILYILKTKSINYETKNY